MKPAYKGHGAAIMFFDVAHLCNRSLPAFCVSVGPYVRTKLREKRKKRKKEREEGEGRKENNRRMIKGKKERWKKRKKEKQEIKEKSKIR